MAPPCVLCFGVQCLKSGGGLWRTLEVEACLCCARASCTVELSLMHPPKLKFEFYFIKLFEVHCPWLVTMKFRGCVELCKRNYA